LTKPGIGERAFHDSTERLDAQRTQTGKELLAAAKGLKHEQQALLEAALLEHTYQQSVAIYAQAKHDQVERIENRLEKLYTRQMALCGPSQSRPPGLLATPSKKQAWQTSQSKKVARLSTLIYRKEAVREIKEGMGLYAPKVEELATRKMRAKNPELATNWDAMREATRKRLILQEKERKRSQQRGSSRSLRHSSFT